MIAQSCAAGRSPLQKAGATNHRLPQTSYSRVGLMIDPSYRRLGKIKKLRILGDKFRFVRHSPVSGAMDRRSMISG